MVDIESLYGPREPEDVEELGRDLVRLVRQYCAQHPSALGQLAGHNPVPEYAFNHEPYAIPAPRSDWPEPPLPPGVDWESNDHGVLAYTEKVMVFHLVNAAHSIVRLHDPTLHSDPHGDPVKLVRLRDISIGSLWSVWALLAMSMCQRDITRDGMSTRMMISSSLRERPEWRRSVIF